MNINQESQYNGQSASEQQVGQVSNNKSTGIRGAINKIKQKIECVWSDESGKDTKTSTSAEQIRNQNMTSDEIALELVDALNSDNREVIDALFDKMNEDNSSTVYRQYFVHAKEIKEHAGSFFSHKGSTRPETLLQGIINNSSLSKDEKIEYMNRVLDKLYDNAVKYRDFYGTTNAELESFQKRRSSNVKDCITLSNANLLEDKVRSIYHWY